jgi:hypothetical protein
MIIGAVALPAFRLASAPCKNKGTIKAQATEPTTVNSNANNNALIIKPFLVN